VTENEKGIIKYSIKQHDDNRITFPLYDMNYEEVIIESEDNNNLIENIFAKLNNNDDTNDYNNIKQMINILKYHLLYHNLILHISHHLIKNKQICFVQDVISHYNKNNNVGGVIILDKCIVIHVKP